MDEFDFFVDWCEENNLDYTKEDFYAWQEERRTESAERIAELNSAWRRES